MSVRAVVVALAVGAALAAPAGALSGAMPRPAGAEATLKRWSLEAMPRPPGTTNSEPFAVSCPSRTACIAVGDLTNHSGTGVTLAERWNGVRWSLERTPSRAVNSRLLGGFEDVSCLSARLCIAVGAQNARTFAARWNGTSWLTQPTPSPSTGADLQGVSCRSAAFCTAVGWALKGATVTEHWNGRRWSIQPAPQPPGGKQNTLYSVSCPSRTVCVAVGNDTTTSGTTVPLVEGWNGVAWTIQPSVLPSGSANGGLFSVSCPRTRSCTAVGYFTANGVDRALAEHWNGVAWSIDASTGAGHATGELTSVSCSGPASCMAVGYRNHAGTTLPLAQRWNGAHWSAQHIPLPAGAKDTGVSGVSCPTAGICAAVGSFTNRSGLTAPFAARYS